MGEKALATSTFKVGKWTCTMTIPRPRAGVVAAASCEWSPTVPTRLSKKELRQYRAGREATMTMAVEELGGGSGLVVEI